MVISTEEIGQKISARRDEIGMKQITLAGKLHVAKATLSRYESGQIAIGNEDLQRVAGILGVPMTYFYPEGEPEPDNRRIQTAAAKAIEALREIMPIERIPHVDDLAEAGWGDIDDEDRAAILDDIRRRRNRRK